MTDDREIERLVAKMIARGARVQLNYRATPQIQTVQIFDAPGIGQHPMSPLSAAERMREFLAG